MRALRRLLREQDPNSPFVFTSERGGAVAASFARMVEQWVNLNTGSLGPEGDAATYNISTRQIRFRQSLI